MSATPTEEDFRPHLGTKFGVRIQAPRPLELELTEVRSYNPKGVEQSEMERFSLLFDGPGDMMLPQGTYTLVHPEAGELLLFIVPVGRDERGFHYEVVFNYFKNK
jgi:hypothetical protein